jgi:hypothetical protein
VFEVQSALRSLDRRFRDVLGRARLDDRLRQMPGAVARQQGLDDLAGVTDLAVLRSCALVPDQIVDGELADLEVAGVRDFELIPVGVEPLLGYLEVDRGRYPRQVAFAAD